MTGRRAASRSAGFTLVELVVVVAIVAVLAAMGAPSFRAVLINQRLASAAQAFTAALGFARSEAIQRAQGVEVAALQGGDWSQGWAVRTGADASLQTLRRFDRLPPGVSVDATLGDGFAQGLRYDGNGFSRHSAGGGFSAGCLTLKAETGRRTSIVVAASGRAKVCDPDVSGDCGSGACARGGKVDDGGA